MRKRISKQHVKNIKKNFFNNNNDTENTLEVKTGRVVRALPAALFEVRFDDNTNLICFLKGKIKIFKIKILVGDKVEVEIDPYGGKGRIVRRM